MAALIDTYLTPDIEALIRAVETRAAQPTSALTTFMQRLAAIAAGESTLCRYLMLAAGQPLRERLRGLLRELVQSAQGASQLRTDLSPAYLADALLGLSLFPFLDTRAGGNANDTALRHSHCRTWRCCRTASSILRGRARTPDRSQTARNHAHRARARAASASLNTGASSFGLTFFCTASRRSISRPPDQCARKCGACPA